MPLPKRKTKESYDAFIDRCMGDPVMVKEFPDAAQRRAVCERQAKIKAKKQLSLVCDPGAIILEASGDKQPEEPVKLPRFSMVAYTGRAMRVGGWRYPVVVDLNGLEIPSQRRPIRFGHDMASGVGHTDSIRVEQNQLIATGIVSRETPIAQEIVASAKNGFPWQASIGVSVEDFEFIKKGQNIFVNGNEVSGPVNVIRRAILGEISFVDLGADGATSVHLAAQSVISRMEDDFMDEEKVLKTNESQAIESGQSHNAEAQGQVNANAANDTQAVEAARILAIRQICAGQHPDIEEKAILEKWDVSRTALELLRAARPKAPIIHSDRNRPITSEILECACLLSARDKDVEKRFDEQTLDAATGRFRGGIGLQELLLEAAWANGYTGRTFRDSRTVLRYAFRPDLVAGFSTVDISGILSNVANKFLLDGFYSVERTWRNICSTRNVSDFKTVTSYRLTGVDQYEKVAPGGELKHGTLGEETFTNKADTYGLMLTIDRQDIINDDLGAITLIPRKLGRGSGLKLNDVFWTEFMDNATFFTAARGNYSSGASTALSIDSLTSAEVLFMSMTDADGKPTGIMPAILLVPTSLSATGSQLYKSMELRDTTASTKYPVANPHQGKFRVETSRYLSNTSYTGYSSLAWYLLADPNDLAVIEVAFLNGQESPTIETADADFSVLGIQMRGYHDFGVALQDYRAGVKMKGEA